MLWLCIQFPRLPLETLTRAQHKRTETVPQAVVEKQLVVDANGPARQRGVETGLTVATACALCSDLSLLTRDTEREAQLLRELAQWGYSFTPVVSPQAAGTIADGDMQHACLQLELSGCLKARGGLQPLLQQLRRELRQMRISARMGLGHSPSAARMLSQLPEHSQWLRDTRTPPSPQQWRQWISFSPCKLLDCDNRTLAKLYACGIKRVSQLLAIPLSEVGSRFGRDFVQYLARLNGSRQDPVPGYQPPVEFHRELPFPSPLENSEQLLFPAGRLVRELCQQLQRRQLYTQKLRWKLDFGRQGCKVVSVETSRPLLDPQRLIALTRLQLERLSLEQPVQSLHLTCDQLQPLEQTLVDEDLFADSGKLQRSHQLLDKLRARLGHQALSGVSLRESHLPEQAWQTADTPLADRRGGRKGRQLQPAGACRPNWLLARPTRLRHRGQRLFHQGEMQLLQGPERIDGYWWQRCRHARDYYIASGRDGSLYWVFQDLSSEEWYLHGIYA
ncbi:DNA polymerase Y family protein [Microbulbifer sp. TYP-18]|uniref:DNA polymerase Y family protein n=1 Tax=Microbulbifer sp. TYP-18 TaxID=3230024 RepID=UPI0034C62B5E